MKKRYLKYIINHEEKIFQKKFASIFTQAGFLISKFLCKQGKQFYNLVRLYPYCIGSCIRILPATELIKHLRRCHKNIFYEIKQNEKIFPEECVIEIDTLPKNYDCSFLISMGLFFINIKIHKNNELTGIIKLVENIPIEQFQCRLAFENRDYQVKLIPCLHRRWKESFSLHTNRDEMLHLTKGKLFKCTLIISQI
ncbi:unnamed protein product [Heterotrigona itama]|uniref:Uncharacterized protein n=1 Tax=Heterotrigona itama TaxID=395501 RepID=A0A6V7H4V8_9HYME|nr:unnamed protein product [Heterotrigona itama]